MSVAGIEVLAGGSAHPEEEARFARFIDVFLRRFKDSAFLDGVDCRESHRKYVFEYYSKTFTRATQMDRRHWRWFRRLEPILALPRGARVLDYGGGYGMDSIFLASCGYEVTLFEVSPHHLAIARRLGEELSKDSGPLRLHFVQGTPASQAAPEVPLQDAVLLDEVAHHIEPPEKLFARCAAIIRRGGSLFLLEPNFWNPLVQAYFFKVRGVRTTIPLVDEISGAAYLYGNEHLRPRHRWAALAAGAGFRLCATTFLGKGSGMLQAIRGIRDVSSSHVTMQFERLPQRAGS